MRKSLRGVVAAGHELTAQAAERVLREGGNAFDAALAAMCAACVTEPVLTSFAGGGFLLARTADGKSLLYDFFVQTPRAGREEAALDFHPVSADFGPVQQTFHIGLGSVAVPGFVKGLFEIHRELGSVPFREVITPAIGYAREGVRLNPFQAYIFKVVAPIYAETSESRSIYGSVRDRSQPPSEGEVMRQVQLADTMEVLAIEGERLFYEGEIGQSLAAECASGGGCVTRDDLTGYRLERRTPLSVDYRGARVLTNPPPSSGGILVAFALSLLESVRGLHDLEFGSLAHLELMATVMQQTNQARIEAALHETLVRDGTTRLLEPELLERYRREVLGRAQSLRGTTHINVMDAQGNVATLSLSNGAASGHLIPDTGIMLNNMLGEQDLNPDGFHQWPKDQRMTSMMAPSIVMFDSGRTVATGSGGSNRIRTAVLQVLVNLIDFGMDVERAVASPRIFLESDALSVEGGFRGDAIGRMRERYPDLEEFAELNLFFGGTHTIDHEGESFHGAGDPRRGGVCITIGP